VMVAISILSSFHSERVKTPASLVHEKKKTKKNNLDEVTCAILVDSI
jgi:hypothetical protein